MIPLLVQPISNEESTNILPVPWIRFLRCRFHGIDRLVHATVLAVTARRSPQQDHQRQNRRQQQRHHAQENELPMGIDHGLRSMLMVPAQSIKSEAVFSKQRYGSPS